MIEGKQVIEPEKIKAEALIFFTNLFKEEAQNRPIFSNLNFKQLSESQAKELIDPFSHTKLDEAVALCNSSKSPGPDVFNFNLIESSCLS